MIMVTILIKISNESGAGTDLAIKAYRDVLSGVAKIASSSNSMQKFYAMRLASMLLGFKSCGSLEYNDQVVQDLVNVLRKLFISKLSQSQIEYGLELLHAVDIHTGDLLARLASTDTQDPQPSGMLSHSKLFIIATHLAAAEIRVALDQLGMPDNSDTLADKKPLTPVAPKTLDEHLGNDGPDASDTEAETPRLVDITPQEPKQQIGLPLIDRINKVVPLCVEIIASIVRVMVSDTPSCNIDTLLATQKALRPTFEAIGLFLSEQAIAIKADPSYRFESETVVAQCLLAFNLWCAEVDEIEDEQIEAIVPLITALCKAPKAFDPRDTHEPSSVPISLEHLTGLLIEIVNRQHICNLFVQNGGFKVMAEFLNQSSRQSENAQTVGFLFVSAISSRASMSLHDTVFEELLEKLMFDVSSNPPDSYEESACIWAALACQLLLRQDVQRQQDLHKKHRNALASVTTLLEHADPDAHPALWHALVAGFVRCCATLGNTIPNNLRSRIKALASTGEMGRSPHSRALAEIAASWK
eukprot:jgi/Hompol1/5637/HPOL_004607-RA